MKAYELAKILDEFSSILKSGPDVEVNNLLKLFKLSLSTSKSTYPKSSNKIIPNHKIDVSKLTSLPPEELYNELKNSSKYSAISIRELAKAAGIISSSRQNRDALIHTIVRHFESLNMDQLIRETHNTKKFNDD
ncbi:hypothetical protein ACXX2Q_000724 [Yersinia enterocolitica]|uniref:hypothetical protein n=1 Tax=Yersinia kristensenii TaxID=28152 RepID=UPI0011A8F84C|nr:hypothetical protein [Yersinia kristensenii]HDL8134487.1 hypothetical protein [Yersinia enterocolitica]